MADALIRLGVAPTLVSGADVASVEVAAAPDGIGGSLVTRSRERIDLKTIRGVYARPDPVVPDPSQREMWSALHSWTDLTPAIVINRSRVSLSNHSKPYQLQLISEMGFDVPDTLVTTDPEEVLNFWSLHRDVVYKSVSGVRSIVSRLEPRHRDRLVDVMSCPTQFQRYVRGVDHRVHVVGGRVFAARVDSAAIDYRYAANEGLETTLHAVELPIEISDRCIALTAGLGLEFSGIDLRLGVDGRWWCFEVNTSPGFTWFERQTGHSIAHAVAERLLSDRAEHAGS